MRPAFLPKTRTIISGLTLAGISAGLSAPATADFKLRSYITGGQLYQVCSEDRDSCYMYVYGVLDKLMLNDDASKTCVFNPEGVAGDKAVEAVRSYIVSHQDRLNWSAAALVQNAVASKFPCAKKKGTQQPDKQPAPDTGQ